MCAAWWALLLSVVLLRGEEVGRGGKGDLERGPPGDEDAERGEEEGPDEMTAWRVVGLKERAGGALNGLPWSSISLSPAAEGDNI